MPALEALLERFQRANTQPLGLSVDSAPCHANWAQSLGGVSFPLLADFHPKGAVASAYGLYLDQVGITDRATVIIDAGGVVRHVSSVSPSGERDLSELAALCEAIDAAYAERCEPLDAAPGVEPGLTLFIKSSCGFSRAVLLARDNLHLGDDVLPVRNVTEDPEAMELLERLTGKRQAPCLVTREGPMLESRDIIRYLVKHTTGLWPAR